MAAERESTRRDLLRLFGRAAAEAAGKRLPLPPPPPPSRRPGLPPPEPPVEAPLERGHLVVDLALHPVPAQTARRVENPGWPGPVLLVRVRIDHFAAVDADCPHCGSALAWVHERDAAVCPRGEVSFRMDGLPFEGRSDAELRIYPCFLAGPRLEIGLLGE